MSTRAGIGFRHNGQDWLVYKHSDGGMAWLGKQMMTFCRSYTPEHMRNRLSELLRCDECDSPTKAQLSEVARALGWDQDKLDEQMAALRKKGSDKLTWYEVLNESQGDLSVYMEKVNVWPDIGPYLEGGSDAEWGYIINLDDGLFEIYTSHYSAPGHEHAGYTKVKAAGRYSKIVRDEDEHRDVRGLTLIDAIPLRDIQEIPQSALNSFAERIDRLF